jgi:hypothetical protein
VICFLKIIPAILMKGAFQIAAPLSGCGRWGHPPLADCLPWLVSSPASDNLKCTLHERQEHIFL